MKKLILALLLCSTAFGQVTNPQPDFITSEYAPGPSLLLNFNDTTTSFKDRVSGQIVSPTVTLGLLPSLTGMTNAAAGYADANYIPLPAGTLASVSIQFCSTSGCTVPGSGTVVTGFLATINSISGGAASLTITNSFSITTTGSSAVQTFTAGAGIPSGVAVAQGQIFGIYTTSASVNVGRYNGAGGSFGISRLFFNSASLPSGANSYTRDYNATFSIAATVTANSGTVTPRQPGFDFNLPNNTAATVLYDGFLSAPNTTLGDLEWSNPWSIYVHLNHFTYDKLGATPDVILSKGDTADGAAPWWELEAIPDTQTPQPLVARLCFFLRAPSTIVPTQIQACTPRSVDMSGSNYDIALTNNGDGWIDGLSLYINGINGGGAAASDIEAVNNMGFDPISATASGGTGCPNPTYFSSTGGGSLCVVTGSFPTSGGAATGGLNYTENKGCTTAPTIGPTGCTTNPTFSITTHTSTLSTASGNVMSPLMVGASTGVSLDNSQPAINVDEVAIYPSVLTTVQQLAIFNHTAYYQSILGPPPVNPPLWVADDDIGNDLDDSFMLAEMIRLHQLGYIKLVGVVDEDATGSCNAMWRQMLDQAGLSSVPLGTAFTYSSGGSGCFPANITAYNASTPTASGGIYLTASQVYRTVLAKYPSTPVFFAWGGPFTGVSQFMQSAADSISPLTGAQLLAQDATNGGAAYNQGAVLCTPSAPPAPIPCTGSTSGSVTLWDASSQQYVLANNASFPIYIISNTPQSSGPGIFSSRTSKDPLYQWFNSLGTETRSGWDPIAFTSGLASFFTEGIQIANSGGTGYANYTPLTETGGGTNAVLNGWLKSTGGVPQYVVYQDGDATTGGGVNQFSGIGHGFTLVPTIGLTGATGTGVTLTAYLNYFCGTYSVSISGGTYTQNITSATCSNHYILPYASTASLSANPNYFQWFVNSLDNAGTIPRTP